MKEYHKINSLFKRDMESKNKILIIGKYSMSEYDYLKNNTWTFTEKIDGTNVRVAWSYLSQTITFKGKTDNAQMPASLYEILAQKFTKDKFIEQFPETDVCLYGEGYGVKIQSGGNYLQYTNDFILFDIRIGEWWLKREDVEGIAYALGISCVPIIGEGNLTDMVEMVRVGFSSRIAHNKEFIAEGIVARPKVELKARNGERIITKLKYCDFRGDKQ